jgi:DNA-binding response OmpR family regulator
MARILIIDDDSLTRNFLTDACEQFMGHETAQARNLEEALELTASFSPDAILLDQRLGEHNAGDYLKAVAETIPYAVKTPKWIVSGERPLDWDEELMKSNGVAGYFVKPCRMDELKAALDAALGRDK